jgi:tRNA-specific 2-thiouridylase
VNQPFNDRKLPLPPNKSPNLQNLKQSKSVRNVIIAVAMSGGVDSSVAAALLVEQGFEVIGMMLRLWSEPGTKSINRCCSPEAMAQAKRVCAQLGIPFYAIDAQDVFYNQVVEYFIDGYTQGTTPNPCLQCNRHIRWEFLLNHALAFGAQFMATGHYARLRKDSNRIQLLKAVDQDKDQSYVLHVLNQDQLSKAVFPLGNYSKSEVRELARRFDLPVADRPESQDLCFLGDGDYREFLSRNLNQEVIGGTIISSDGETLGTHTGLVNYTIGQRRGLGISSPVPLYVLKKDLEGNALIVGSKDDLDQRTLWANKVNWVSIEPPLSPVPAQVKIRYKSIEEPAIINPIQEESVEVKFDRKIRSITPGQAAVFYRDEICIGGGIIYATN